MASPRRWASALVAGAALSLLAFPGPASAAPTDLVGTFTITPGACSGAPSGSYFRMILPTGTATGPFVENSDSKCGDRTYTLFVPGTDGGLVTGGYQPAPSPGFDSDGNSVARRIIQPVKFFGKNFSVSTNPTDLQAGGAVPAPVLRADGVTLSGDLTAFDATWNHEAFNQGAPKPDGSTPGNTAKVSGTYDAATGRYTLTWASQIVGGPFDNFTGQWHLEGTFRPAGAAASQSPGTTVAAAAGPRAPQAPGAAPAAGEPVADAAPSTTAAATPVDDERAIAATVTDDSFKVPTAVVVLIALLGIAGVVVLVALDRKPTPEVEP
jgi:hypothetical protein